MSTESVALLVILSLALGHLSMSVLFIFLVSFLPKKYSLAVLEGKSYAKDSVPNHADAIFVPSYCLKRGGSRLTKLSELCVNEAILLVSAGKADHIIFSNAYKFWRKEAGIKRTLAIEGGVNPENIHLLEEVTDTYDEAKKAGLVLEKIGGHTMILAAELYHMPRLIRAMTALLPGVTLYEKHIYCSSSDYEMAAEPSIIKSVRAGFRDLWILWNLLLYCATPLILKRVRTR